MYNQTDAILAQYDIEVKQTTKGRGSYICDTDRGKKLLVLFRGSCERGEALKQYLEELAALTFDVEQIYPNREGGAVTVDEVTGERFILKTAMEGTELDPQKREDMKSAARLLGRYHRITSDIPPEKRPQILTEKGISAVEIKRKHYRELIKIRNHIRGKKKKNEFERQFMEHCNLMIATALRSVEMLEGQKWQEEDYCFCHGDYNQHNVLRHDGNWYMIHMENVTYSLPMEDVANYLRKMMEKNQWDISLGEQLIMEYDAICHMNESKRAHLYALLLFPERFWKITNHYMNSHKAWLSQRDIEKLEKVIAQEEIRVKFIENLFSIYK